jgi:predicted 3-demethylubiquinone-9 3-methyltransferase (glyoxalase superfamily)
VSTSYQRIVPNIWFSHAAEEAGRFYARALPSASSAVESRYPMSGLPDFQLGLAGEPLTVALDVKGTRFTLINAGDEFRPTPAISFLLNVDPSAFAGAEQEAQDRLDAMWEMLADGGEVRIGLGEHPFSSRYGWIEDRYGVNWQLMLTDPADEPRPFVIPALTFGGAVQDRAAEASDFYVSLFAHSPGGAQVGIRHPYGVATGPARSGALAFGEFRIGGQWFMALDSGADRAFSFTEGVSLEVRCHGQAEIDRLWGALSAVPEAEQCGWLKDRYGVSWQIVPENMDELMSRPHAWERMMSMRKLVIADF